MAAPTLQITVAGTDRTSKVRYESIRIADVLNDAPNTAQLRVAGFVPTKGQEIKIGLGGVATLAQLLFAGHILKVTQVYEEKAANISYDLECIDYTWKLGHRLVTKLYTATSATDIIIDLMTFAVAGFTTTNVVAAMPTLDEISFTWVSIPDAISRVMERAGGYWYVDYLKDIHAFITETGGPASITDADLQGARDVTFQEDLSQIRTRVYVEGGGGSATLAAIVGDTSIRVDDDAWYDLGTVVSGHQKLTYSGVVEGFLPTHDWRSETSPDVFEWRSVTWAESLSLFVAVASTGASRVMTSPDGITWTLRTAAALNAWNDVTWAPSLSLFVAVAPGGTNRVMTSPDGITWTSRTAAAANQWFGVTWAASLSLYVAVSNTGTSRVMTSPDGITWTSRTAADGEWNAVTWSPELSLFAAVGYFGGTNRAMTSPDGITWTGRTATAFDWIDITWSPELSLFVAVNTGGFSASVMTSSDGSTWTNRSAVSNIALGGVVWAGELGLFIAVVPSSTTQYVMTSPDGIAWSLNVTPGGLWESVAWSPTLGVAVAVGIPGGDNQIMSNQNEAYNKLVGIPASGAGSIVYDIAVGDPVNLLVQRDDGAAQTALATLIGGDGIVEHYIQDRRLAKAEARDRGDAQLAIYKSALQRLTYRNRDPLASTGKSITATLGAPTSISTTQKIQQVTLSQIQLKPGTDEYPLREVVASSQLYSFEDVLRQLKVQS